MLERTNGGQGRRSLARRSIVWTVPDRGARSGTRFGSGGGAERGRRRNAGSENRVSGSGSQNRVMCTTAGAGPDLVLRAL